MNCIKEKKFSTLIELLQYRSHKQPAAPALGYLADNVEDVEYINYQYLDKWAQAIAVQLVKEKMTHKTAILLYEPGIEFLKAFFGCVYAGCIAIPLPLPRRPKHLSHILSILKSAEPALLLSVADIHKNLDPLFQKQPELNSLPWCCTDSIAEELAMQWQRPEINPASIAYLQYTSGSTATPKGVIISHENILQNSESIAIAAELNCESVSLSWLPHFHDMGLVFGYLQPVYSGCKGIVMAPSQFMRKPWFWLRAISHFKATISGGPNFAYELCSKQAGKEAYAGLDLSSWQIAFTGAEPIRATTLRKFAAAFNAYGFRFEQFAPCYGMAEATLMISGYNLKNQSLIQTFDPRALWAGQVVCMDPVRDGGQQLVSCGKPVTGMDVQVIDPSTNLVLEECRIGEIWVNGKSVSTGYYRNPAATEETFLGVLDQYPSKRFLKTGDLGFIKEGQLFITGRIKDLIIIHGKNYYPQDIEKAVAESHLALSPFYGAAFSMQTDEGEQLVVVHEVNREHLIALDLDNVVSAIRKAIFNEFEIVVRTIIIIHPYSLPLTSSGKVKRQQVQRDFLEKNLKVIGSREFKSQEQTLPDDSADRTAFRSGELPPDNEDHRAKTESWLRNWLTSTLAIKEEELYSDIPFTDLGLTSVTAVELAEALGQYLNRQLPDTLVWDCPNMTKLLAYLFPSATGTDTSLSAADEPVFDRDMTDAIAVVGMACRFPGANNPESFWQLLMQNRSITDTLPATRWTNQEKMNPDGNRAGCLLKDIEGFDANFFQISPKEARYMDPQQRILLEVAWHALEDACLPDLSDKEVGVFVGASSLDYSQLQFNSFADLSAYSATGNALSILANRLSYFLDLHGPSMTIDTACSSSLVALHLACQSLRNKESEIVIAGGVNILISPYLNYIFQEAGMLAPDGRCKTFDDKADGYVRGEGCGVVVLMPLSKALATRRKIYGLIRGSAVNHDGKSNGLTAPNSQAQEKVIKQAHRAAGITPQDIGFIEAHGTGTSLGDPIEVDALTKIFVSSSKPDNPCYLGSLKSNIGHLEAAAGIAGFIKAVLTVKNGTIPATCNYHTLNTRINLASSRIRIAQQNIAWERESKRLAGISSFGFGGTNAHLIVENFQVQKNPEKGKAPFLLLYSAADKTALNILHLQYKQFLSKEDSPSLETVCFTANAGRKHLQFRDFCIGYSKEDFIKKPAANGPEKYQKIYSKGLVFILQGIMGDAESGSHAYTMYDRNRSYRNSVDACFKYLENIDETIPNLFTENNSILPETTQRFARVHTFIHQYALGKLLIHLGLVPSALLYDHPGKITGLSLAGILKLNDALQIIVLIERFLHERNLSGQDIQPLDAIITETKPDCDSEWTAAYEKKINELVTNLQLSENHFSFVYNADIQEFLTELVQVVSWPVHYTRPYAWQEKLRLLAADGVKHFLQLNLNTGLNAERASRLPETEQACLLLPGTQEKAKDPYTSFLTCLGELFVQGYNIRWDHFYASETTAYCDLPLYPFQHVKYWLHEQTSSLADLLYQESWVEYTEVPAPAPPVKGAESIWLIYMDKGGLGDLFLEPLEGLGIHPLLIFDDELSYKAFNEHNKEKVECYYRQACSLERLFQEKGEKIAKVLYLNQTDYKSTINEDYLNIQKECEEAALTIHGHLLALQKVCATYKSEIWLFTQNAIPFDEGRTALTLTQSVTWGIGKCFALEYPANWGGMLDLPGDVNPPDLARVCNYLNTASGEDLLLLRNNRLYVSRLQRTTNESAVEIPITGDGSYLISGGTGSLGLKVCDWLINKGAKNIILTSRRGSHDEHIRTYIRDCVEKNVQIRSIQADISDPEQIKSRLLPALKEMPALKGIIHAAGILENKPFEALTAADFHDTYNPKISGTLLLSEIAREHKIDFFIAFSSIASVWGSRQQAHYASAHQVQDTVMAILAKRFKTRFLAVNWGPWRASRMVKESDLHLLAGMGIHALSADDNLALLGKLLNRPGGRLVVASVDWSKFAPLFNFKHEKRYFENFSHTTPAQREIKDLDLDLLKKLQAGPDIASKELLATLLKKLIKESLGISDETELDNDQGFFEMGMDSIMDTKIRNTLENKLGITLSSSILFNYPTVNRAVSYLLETHFKKPLATAVYAEVREKSTVEPESGHEDVKYQIHEPIAVIGMGCKFPGGVNCPDDFWDLLINKKNAITKIAFDRWDNAGYYHEQKNTDGKTYIQHGAFIDDVYRFDNKFFNISDREALHLDPQQRILLEVCLNTFRDAGLEITRETESNTGVFIGASYSDYPYIILSNGLKSIDPYFITGNALNALAGRIAYYFRLRGPAVVIDTACSSSLASVHHACLSLRHGECDAALAGGINLILSPVNNIATAHANMNAVDGQCKTFDARADGYVRGEGCGILLLKRLSDAVKNHDPIYAVLKASAINHNGTSSGLTVPNGRAQVDLINKALKMAGIKPEEIGYVEAHGTGTALGDPIEINALAEVFQGHARAKGPLWVGSVKTNIGHLEAAAGIAGLIKLILAVKNQKIPPNLNFQTPNPHLDWQTIPIKVPVAETDWKTQNTRCLGGVSAFGFSGTNVHIIAEEYPLTRVATTAGPGDRQRTKALDFLHKKEFKVGFNDANYTRDKNDDYHPLAQNQFRTADRPEDIIFQSGLSAHYPAYLKDHKIYNQMVVPATAFIEMVLYSAYQLNRQDNSASINLEVLSILKPIKLETTQTVQTQLIITKKEEFFLFRIYSTDGSQGFPDWSLHAEGKFNFLKATEHSRISLDAYKHRGENTDFYASLERNHLNYGDTFRTVVHVHQQDEDVYAVVRLPVSLNNAEKAKYRLHPVLLDGIFQSLSLLNKAAHSADALYVPASIYGLELYASCGDELYAKIHDVSQTQQQITAAVSVYNGTGEPVCKIHKLVLNKITRRFVTGGDKNVFYVTKWIEKNSGLVNRTEQDKFLLISDKTQGTDLHEKLQSILGYEYQVINEYTLDAKTAATINERIKQDFKHLVFLVNLGGKQMDDLLIYPAGIPLILQLSRELAPVQKIKMTFVLYKEPATAYNPGVAESMQSLIHVWANENPSVPVKCILIIDEIREIQLEKIKQELVQSDTELNVKLEDNTVYVKRLIKAPEPNLTAGRFIPKAEVLRQVTRKDITRFKFDYEPVREPGDNEVCIQVKSSALNFKDVLHGLGLLEVKDNAEVSFGFECAGVIAKLGRHVTGWTVGDKVMASMAYGCMNRYVNVPALCMAPLPPHMSFQEGATLSIAYLTVFYALNKLTRLKRGQKILIHAGAGGVGQAAIHYCRYIGARIYVTASQGKWEHLQQQGIGYIYNSRNTAYYEEIKRDTDGEGLDFVLNCLNGEHIEKSLALCKPGASFIEIGKIGIWSPEKVRQFREDIRYYTFDLSEIAQNEPAQFQAMLRELQTLWADRQLAPLPFVEFPVTGAAKAFYHMAQAKNIGKIIISRYPEHNPGEIKLSKDSVYLVTGGTGGLGWKIIKRMVKYGARKIIALSRSGQFDEEQTEFMASLEDKEIVIRAVRCDLGRKSELQAALEYIKSLGELRGIVHTAGALADSLLKNLEKKDFELTFQAKVIGTDNLLEMAQAHTLDFFICFSSVAALLNPPGQANYAMANAYMDAKMVLQEQAGRPGLSINWGPWLGTGMAGQLDEELKKRIKADGIEFIQEEDGLDIFMRLLERNIQGQVGVFDFNQEQVLAYLKDNDRTFFSHLLTTADNRKTDKQDLLVILEQAPLLKRKEKLISLLTGLISKLLLLENERVLNSKTSLFEQGFDSLLTIQFINQIENNFNIKLDTAALYNYSSIDILADYILGKIPGSVTPAEQRDKHQTGDSRSDAETGDASEEELDNYIDNEFKKLF